MSDEEYSDAPIDVATLEILAQRSETHPLVRGWSFQPDGLSPRRLELTLDVTQYPPAVDATRLDVRWFEGGDYTVHYLETRGGDVWQCRWDRHPEPGELRAHFHPPPEAGSDLEPGLGATHHLDLLFSVLDWVTERIEALHQQ